MLKIFDAVTCVGPLRPETSLTAVRSLQLHAGQRKIFVVTSRKLFPFFEDSLEPNGALHLVDEDEVIEGVSLQAIREYLEARAGAGARAGWYFQQFLKMAMCGHPEIGGHYLVWDSDTVALRPLAFFDADGRVLVSPKGERHPPYFVALRKLLGIERQVSFSFIAEHLMIDQRYMLELIEALRGSNSRKSRDSWVWRVLDVITDRDLGGSGFSEYETYGNFIAARYPDSFRTRRLKSTRHAGLRFGSPPAREPIHFLLLSGHSVATFEASPRLRPVIAFYRAWARAVYSVSRFASRWSSRSAARLAAAAELCPPSRRS